MTLFVERKSERDRSVMAALIGAAAVVVAAGITALAAREGDDPARMTQTPSASAPRSEPSSTPESTPSSLSDPVARLMAYLPASVSNCSPTDTPFGALVRLKCKAEPAEGQVDADVYFSLYDGVGSSRSAFDHTVPADVPVSLRVCPAGPDRSDYRSPDLKKAGELACWVDASNNAPYIVWTRDDLGVMGVAVAPVGTKLKRLWDVWLNVPISQRPDSSPTPS